MEVLSMKVSQCQNYVGIIGGKNLIKMEEALYQIIIYRVNSDTKFSKIVDYDLPEEYRSFSRTFEFCTREDLSITVGQSLYLISSNQIVGFDPTLEEDKFKTLFNFKNDLGSQPDFSVFSPDQMYSIIATKSDALWFKLKNPKPNSGDDD